jgi:hypothetical protein
MFGLLDVQVETGNRRVMMGANKSIRGNTSSIIGSDGTAYGDFNEVKQTAEELDLSFSLLVYLSLLSPSGRDPYWENSKNSFYQLAPTVG